MHNLRENNNMTAKELNELSYKIIGCVYNVYNTLGPGLLESVYERAMVIELRENNIRAANQVNVDIDYNGIPLNLDLRIDILVEDAIILELKSVENMQPLFEKQLFTDLKLADKRLGLLINFNAHDITKGIKRIVHNF